ncbi:hypothetical protein ACFUIY_21280 [Streptomyces griseorubiginosus]|uniref:hypothetical protein n=1 Tax=Streptomyces griseorubiginosus TaxID=67304 RepID=UPI00363B524D
MNRRMQEELRAIQAQQQRIDAHYRRLAQKSPRGGKPLDLGPVGQVLSVALFLGIAGVIIFFNVTSH